MSDPSYNIGIEFVSGSFTEVGSDCRRFTISREAADAFAGISTGRASFVMDNYAGRWSPANSASPYSPHLTTNKPIRVTATYAGSTYNLFKGFIDRYSISPDLSTRTAMIEASDRVKDLQLRKIDLPLATETNAGSLFTDILSAAAVTSSDRTIDRMYDTIPYAWYADRRPNEAMNDLLLFGNYRLYAGPDGKINVKNRYWGIEGTVVGSYVNDFYGLEYGLTEERILNDVKIEGQPRKRSASVNTVAWLESIPTIAASSAIGFWLHYVDPANLELDTPANSMVTPVSSADYKTNTASDGLGVDRTSLASVQATFFGASAVCSIFNGSGDAVYLTKFQLRGYSIQRQAPILYESRNTSSQNAYGKRDYTLRSDLIADLGYAKDYSEFMITENKEPAADVRFEIKQVFPDILARELGDIVHLVESNTAVASLWTIRSIDHDVTLERGLEHTLRCGVEFWRDREYLILDHATRGQLDVNRLAF